MAAPIKYRSVRRRQERRDELWPGQEAAIWPPPEESSEGWFKGPRILPIVLAVLDQSGVREKKEDFTRTYLELLSRNMGDGFVEVIDEEEAAMLSGFTGKRRRRSWIERIRALEHVKLIKVKPVGAHPIGAILMMHPIPILRNLRRRKLVPDNLWNLLHKRYLETANTNLKDPSPSGGRVRRTTA